MKRLLSTALLYLLLSVAAWAQTQPPTYKLENLTAEEIQLIWNQLAEGPWRKVHALIVKIDEQVKAQMQPKEDK